MQIINKPIDVIAQHTNKGDVTPIRFRIKTGDDFKVFNLKVISCETLNIEKIKYLAFLCELKMKAIKKDVN